MIPDVARAAGFDPVPRPRQCRRRQPRRQLEIDECAVGQPAARLERGRGARREVAVERRVEEDEVEGARRTREEAQCIRLDHLRLLAAEGYSVAGIDYSLAPGATYPTPVTQTNAALSYLVAHAADYGYDAGRLALAGDSAGAQIAAQTALTLTDPAYAGRTGLAAGATPDRLKGILLFCGGLDAAHLSLDGPFGGFLSTVLWSYFGHRDVLNDPRLADFSIPQSLHTGFPPLFITVGNADPLAAQSYAVAQRASELGLTTETLFFPEDYVPPLEHEYQFDLDSEAGQEAFRRATLFLDRIFAAPP